MLTRTYRLTDKLGVALIKSVLALIDWTLDGLAALVGTLFTGVLVLGGGLLWVLRPVGRAILFLVNSVIRLTGGTAITARRGAEQAMARRAAQRELDAMIVEDPLKRQNRVLSAMTVVLLVALIGAILWATNPGQTGNQPLNAAVLSPLATAPAGAFAAPPPADQPISDLPATPGGVLIATPVPTISAGNTAANVTGGSLAYTVRENAQTDLWVVTAGGRTPIRITNSPEDERDPAWSPDGRRLAYASRRDGNWELYIDDLVAGTSERMTFDLSFQGNPAWSPDGEWLVYESYQGENLDIYVLRVDGSQPPIRLPGNADAPDFAPAWSPDGRRIAFVTLRTGNAEIFTFSLDDSVLANVTSTPTINEDDPAWQPHEAAGQSDLIAYSALEGGAEKVFVRSTFDLAAPAQAITFGRMPSWSPYSPSGSSLVFTRDTNEAGQLTVFPYSGAALPPPILTVPVGSYQPMWTDSPLPVALVNAGGLPPASAVPLFVEQVAQRPSDPVIALQPLPAVAVENAALADTVNDSFNALREMVAVRSGADFLGRLDDAFWRLDRPPQPGEERRSWLMTGRSFAITRSSIVGFPPPLEVVREDLGVDVYWRLYLRAADDAQRGALGEPLRRIPWDFAARTAGDVEAYDQGGRVRGIVPAGYYIDLTQLAIDYGWRPVPAGTDWRANANTIYYWLFEQRGGLIWFDAMRQIYPEGQLINFQPTGLPVIQPAVTAPPLNIVPTSAPTTPPTPIPTSIPVEGLPGDDLIPGAEGLLTPQIVPDSP